MMTTETPPVARALIERVVADYFASIRALDAEAWVETFADDGVRFDPAGAATEGHADLRTLFDTLATEALRLTVNEDLVLLSGDGAAVKWSGRLVSTATDEQSLQGIEVFEIDDHGRIKTVWSYWDADNSAVRITAEDHRRRRP